MISEGERKKGHQEEEDRKEEGERAVSDKDDGREKKQ